MRFVTDILAKANLVVDGSVTLNTTANASVDTDKFLVQDGTVVKYRTGSEVLSDIGAQGALTLTTTGTSGPATLVGNTLNIPQYQAVLTNPITGTGVSGQVAYFNGTTSITGESNLFWDASNDRLGIGTSTPQYSLDSTGVINSTGFGTFLGFSTPPGRTYNYVTSFGSGTTINYPGTGTLGFQYNYFANNEFYTTAGGTSNLLIVGFRNQNYIRSTVSTVPFQMVGFNNRFDMHDANDLATLGILNGVNSGFLREATASSLGGITTAYQFTATTRLRSGFYTTTRWGNENLQVADTTASQASSITDYDFLLNTTNVGSSSGGPGTITNFYLLRHVTNIGATGTITNRWGLYLTDSSFKSYHAGNFLIGTSTDAGYKLDVATGNDNAIRIINSTGSNNNGLALAVGSGTPWIDFWGSRLDIKYNTSPGSWNGGANTFITILSGGNVGIGTTSPTTLLHLQQSSGPTIRLVRTSNRFDITGDNDFLELNARDASTYMIFKTVDTERIRITSGGSVGIGTSSPQAKLQVTNSTSDGIIVSTTANVEPFLAFWRNSASNGVGVLRLIDGGNLYFDNGATGAAQSTKMQLAATGAVRLNSYGSGTFTGTPTYNLAVDASGNIIETAGGVVDGSGTTNYVPKWSDPNTLTNSIIYDNGTNVGIGTTSPSYKLQVQGNAAFATNSGGLRIDSYDGNTAVMLPTVANGSVLISDDSGLLTRGTEFLNGGGVIIQSLSGFAPLDVKSNGSNLLYVTSSGNVGVGTTSPSYKLDVIGNIASNAGTNEAQVFVTNSTSQIYLFNSYAGNTFGIYDGTAGQHRMYYDRGSNFWAFFTGASERMRITSGGNLLVGTTTDAGYKLDVNGVIHNNNAVFVSQGVQGNASGFTFSGLGSNYGRIYEVSNDKWVLGYSASYGGASTVVLSWNASGNVGIGTSAPYGRLELYGSGQSWTTAPAIRMWDSFNGLGWLIGNVNNITAGDFYIRTLPSVSGVPSSTEQQFTIKYSTGNVGIGTTSPTSKLELYNSSGDTRMTVTSTGGTGASDLLLKNASGTVAYEWYVQALGADGRFRIFDNTGGSTGERFTIDQSGNVGIGTSSPNTILEASQSTNGDAAIRITNSNAGTNATAQFFANNGTTQTQFFHTGINYTTGGSQVVNYANLGGIYNASTGIALSAAGASGIILFGTGASQTERMRITSGGNVGIGTTSPNARLEVNQTVSFSSVDTYGQFTIKTTSGANGKLLNFGVDETNSLSFIQSLNRGIDVMPLSLQRYGGNVLVGTSTNNGNKLQVNGTANIDGITRITPTAGIDNWFGYGGSYDNYFTSGGIQVWRSSSTEFMRLDASGKLGIGVNPTYKLDVYGTGGTIAQVKDGSTYAGVVIDAVGTPFTRWSNSGTGKFEVGYYNNQFYFNNNTGVNNTSATMVITSAGTVGINTLSPDIYSFGGTILAVSNASSYANLVIACAGTNGGGISLGNQTIRRAAIEAIDGSNLIFTTNGSNSGTSVTERMRITSVGQIRFAQYTSTSSFPGTAAGFIGFDSSGNLITVASAGGVSGSGTTNYVARWTASTTLGTGVLYDNGTNTSINTSSPVSTNLVGALTIWKTYNSDGGSVPSTTAQNYYENQSGLYVFGRNSTITLVGSNSENNDIFFANASSRNYAVIGTLTGTTSAGGDMYFRTGGNNEAMRITTGGNVGIGTTSPSNLLHVYNNSVDAEKGIIIKNAYAGTSADASLRIDGYAGSFIDFYRNGSLRWRLDRIAFSDNLKLTASGGAGDIMYFVYGSGNVGINTASPTEKLHVDSGSIYINGEATGLIVDAGGSKRIGFMKYGGHEAVISRIAGQDFGIVRVGTSDITNVTGITYDLYVGSSGDVGIGTTSPTYKLDVSGTGRFTGTISGGSNLELVNASGPYILVGEGTGVNQYGTIDWDATNNVLRIATQPYAFGASGGQINLTTGGNVGIGTTAPGGKLDVRGSAYFRGSALGVTVAPSATGADIYFYEAGNPVIYLQSAGHTIFNNGYNFAIGSTSPDGRLYVERTATWSSGNLLGTNTVQYITYGSGASVGTVAISAVGAFQQVYFSGSATIGNGGRHGAIDSILTIGNTSSGTITVSQSSTLRAMSSISAATYFNPGSSTTITHLAGIRVLPDINTGAGAVTVTNKYGVLIGDASGGSGSITYTTRWGIYQEGASDNNYFAAKVLIGTTTATSDALYVNGTAYINGNMTVNGTVTELSSANYKRNISTLENTLEKVDKMRAVSYNRVGGIKKEIGLIAEEVEQVYPEFVEYDNNGRPMGLNYARLTAVLLQSVKELKSEINELKKNIN